MILLKKKLKTKNEKMHNDDACSKKRVFVKKWDKRL